MAVATLAFISPKDVTLGKLLGTGGFGSVYKASHVNWGTVAVKQLKGVTLTDNIKKEAEKMWRAVSSPYLVTIMGIVQDPEGLGIVMEYFENGSLYDFQRKYMQCECWSRKVKMIQDVALGMNYLHTLTPPIIHRDLKVENLFVGDGFEAKIGDLGLAVSSNTSRQVSRVSGTRSHIPPEASTSPSNQPDEFWDIYTFAITTYELTSGKDAWPQQQQFANEALISVWVVQGHRPNLEAIPSDAPEEIVDVIKKCWVAEPKERPRFQEILKTVTELFEKKYKVGIRKADRAILEQMDLVQESTEASDHSSAADSGVDSFWGKFESMNINDARKGATSTDSGIGSVSSIDTTLHQLPASTSLSSRKTTLSPTLLSAQGTTRPSNTRRTNKPPPPVPPKKPATVSRALSPPKAAGIGKTPGKSSGSQLRPTDVHNTREWRLVKEFGVEGDGEGEFRCAQCIAVCHNDDIAVVDIRMGGNGVYFFSKDGSYKSTLKSHTTDPKSKLQHPMDVAVTSQGHLVVADQFKYVKSFDVTGSFLHSFCTLAPDENPKTMVRNFALVVSPEDDIIVGDCARKLVTIHTQADGWAPRKVKVPITPSYLAVNSQRHILVSSDWKERNVISLSMEGKVLFSMDGFCVDGKAGKPKGLVCDSNNDIYIAVMEVDESNGKVIPDTGHIHQYDNTGVFLRCIAKGLYRPLGMTMHNGSLFVANKKSVLIYST